MRTRRKWDTLVLLALIFSPFVILKVSGLRVDEDTEADGLDLSEHVGYDL